MKIIQTGYNIDCLSVPTENQMHVLLERDASIINTKYQYVNLFVGSSIKKHGINETQKIIDKYADADCFFVCQHVLINRLDFGQALVFSCHSGEIDHFITIPHYSMTTSYRTGEKRDILFSFVGSSQTHVIRQALIEMFDNCFDSEVYWAVDSELPDKQRRELSSNYIDLAERSIFSLCPRGAGVSSIRLFEVMSMGSIPVIISDGFKKPNVGADWNDFTVSIGENEIADLNDILGSYSNEKIRNMMNKIGKIYAHFFANENLHRIIVDYIGEKVN